MKKFRFPDTTFDELFEVVEKAAQGDPWRKALFIQDIFREVKTSLLKRLEKEDLACAEYFSNLEVQEANNLVTTYLTLVVQQQIEKIETPPPDTSTLN